MKCNISLKDILCYLVSFFEMNPIITHTCCPVCKSTNIHRVLNVKDHTVSKEFFNIWQCDACTLRFTQNIPDKISIANYYQSENYISHSNTKKGLINTLYHIVRKRSLRKKKSLINYITGKNTGYLLDVGSGIGSFAAYMKCKGWNVTAIEPAEDARKKALEKYDL